MIGREELAAPASTLGAMLGSWATALALRGVLTLPTQALVLAAVLPLTLSRSPRGGARTMLVACPLVALAAGEVATLGRIAPALSDLAYVVALPGAVWARRFGPRAARVARLVALPLVALLVTPAPAPAAAGPVALRVTSSVVVALVAASWVLAARRVALGPVTEATAAVPPARRTHGHSRRLDPSTRLALQLAVALAAAFALGHVLFGEHVTWVVVTAYVVSSGNRGRGDVIHRGAQRLGGALVGVAAATALAGVVRPGSPWLVAGIFAVLGVALVARPRSYAAWAAGVTAALALLHGYYGDGGESLLVDRLAGIVVGALLAIAAAWWVTPLRTVDVLRRRWADALRALTAFAQERTEHHAAWVGATHADLEQLGTTLRAHRRVARRLRAGPHPADVLDAVAACRAAAEDDTTAPEALRQALAQVHAVGLAVCGPGRAAAGTTGPRPRSPRGRPGRGTP